MEKTTRYAKIAKIKKGVVFSDPSYDKNVWCQYRKRFNEPGMWFMKLETTRDEDGYIDISLYLGRRTMMAQVTIEKSDEGEAVSHPSYYNVSQTEIGIDTAKVYVGNGQNFEQWGEEASIYTASDGLFGGLIEFTCKGEEHPVGYVLLACLDGNITDENELFQTLTSSFDAKEIEKEQFYGFINNLGTKAQIAQEVQAAKAFLQENPASKADHEPER